MMKIDSRKYLGHVIPPFHMFDLGPHVVPEPKHIVEKFHML